MTKGYSDLTWFLCAMLFLLVIGTLGFCSSARAYPLTLVTVSTKAGPIVVNRDWSWRFVGFINALPYTPRHVSCYAGHGHVAHSWHHVGGACDVDQTARNRTSHVMYHIHALARHWGLRDGCTFHDCGHVDVGYVAHVAMRDRLPSIAAQHVTPVRIASRNTIEHHVTPRHHRHLT